MSSDYIEIQLSGAAELEQAFDALGEIGAKAAMQRALIKAARPIAAEARRIAPRGPLKGKRKLRIADSILVRTRLSSRQMRRRGGRRAPVEVFVGSSAPHAHLVEFGHHLVRVRRSRLSSERGKIIGRRIIGFVPPHPFLRPAFDTKKAEAKQIFADVLWQELTRVARRYARQAERGKLSRGARETFRVELGL